MMVANYLGGFIGGLLIGSSAVILLYFYGRIAGISGIAAHIIGSRKIDGEFIWRLLFLIGLLSGAFIFALINDGFSIEIQANKFQLIFAGLLVGIGTKIGSGCTSGHGICGISRLSIRSITATVIFMATAIITVYLKKQFGL